MNKILFKDYSSTACDDTALECVTLGKYCNSTYPDATSNTTLVQNRCPLTCGKCLSNQFNPCDSSPCKNGKKCNRLGFWNYICA